MKQYGSDKLRNVCLMGHGGTGKTTLAEAMLYNTGVLDRLGKVTDGTSTMDYDQEEIKRKFSISAAVAPCEWKEVKMNVIDTPGYFDFLGEVKQAVRVSEGAIILLSAKAGIEVGTEKAWSYAQERGIPVFFYISKMDEENANYSKALQQIKDKHGRGVIPFQLPIYEGEKVSGYVDVLAEKAYSFNSGKAAESEMPEDMKDQVKEIREKFNEAIAETSEELMEKYFGGEGFTKEEIRTGMIQGLSDGSIMPVFFGVGLENINVVPLMNAIVEYMPSPDMNTTIQAKKPGSDETVKLKASADEDLAALVFKTIADPFVGRISLIRVFSGTLKSDSSVYNSSTESSEKISQVFVMRGKKQENTEKLIAGDIGAVAKLQNTNTNDTLCSSSNPVKLEKIEFPRPSLTLAIEPKAKGDEEKIGSGLQKLQDEDPTFKVEINSEIHQTLISGIGDQHLDVIVNKLKSKYNVSVDLKDAKIPYRETIKKKVKVEGKHKKQTGGHGQYGHVWIEFEPGSDEGLVFEEKIFGGSVPKQYIPAVEKGLRESIKKGVLAGYPATNLKATLVDGSFHPVDSSEMAFKVAASIAYKKGLADAASVLLEPISTVEVYVPEENMGDIIGDLNKRRGRILGMNPQEGGIQQIVAEVPAAEMFKYATDLRSMTQGRGYFDESFARYEEAPSNVSQKVIEEAAKEDSDEG